jgi:chemotaxis protein histidine kinase CheA
MEKFREDFLIEAVSTTELLLADFTRATSLMDFAHNNLSKLHTLKGSSLAFGLDLPSKLAHAIENLFEISINLKLQEDFQTRDILGQSIVALLDIFNKSLRNEELNLIDDIFAEIDFLTTSRKVIENPSLPDKFPDELLSQLSPKEVKNLQLAVSNEKSTFVIEILLDFADFDDKFRSLRKLLEAKGDILASLPNPELSTSEKVGFRLLFVTKLRELESWLSLAEYNGKIGFNEVSAIKSQESEGGEPTIKNVIERTVVGGEKIAKLLEKEVDFRIYCEEIEVSSEVLRILSDILLHLVRNSIDHGLEETVDRRPLGKPRKGIIEIQVSQIQQLISLKIKDDGRGIDKEKVLKLAIEKELVPATTDSISIEKAGEIIFMPGFTTTKEISEISGRGVGLDVVESIIESLNGKICVFSVFGVGSEFEIYLPVGS